MKIGKLSAIVRTSHTCPAFEMSKKSTPGFCVVMGFNLIRSGPLWGRGVAQVGFGADFKRSISLPGPWEFTFDG